tara:strand:+ start:130 stop:597 length:468 start_codon:yes stop_codon:yes gene_type:complete
MNNKKSNPLSIEDLIVDGTKKATVTTDGRLITHKSSYEKSLDKSFERLVKKGLSKDILSKMIIPDEKADQSSILGIVPMSKSRILVIQSKVWNDSPYQDFRIWYKNNDGNFLPTKKGFMIALSYKENGKDERLPLRDFFNVIDEIRKIPDEKDIN